MKNRQYDNLYPHMLVLLCQFHIVQLQVNVQAISQTEKVKKDFSETK